MSDVRTRYFKANGRVQRVMFRQTLIRAAQHRGLVAGASNTRDNTNEVTFTLSGDNAKIEEILKFFYEKKTINSWGAQVTSVFEEQTGLAPIEHQVNTSNVDTFRWREDVGMYI